MSNQRRARSANPLPGTGNALHDLESCGSLTCEVCWLFGDREDVITRIRAMAPLGHVDPALYRLFRAEEHTP